MASRLPSHVTVETRCPEQFTRDGETGGVVCAHERQSRQADQERKGRGGAKYPLTVPGSVA
jgi:hypothetical protein